MKLHGNARTTPKSRLSLVRRIERGVSIRAAANAVGVSRGTAHKWLTRYRAEGVAGLQDRSSAPHRQPHKTPARVVRRIEALRRKRLSGEAIAERTGVPRSTVSMILRRLGLGRLRDLEPKRPALRYEWPRPGDLLHIDTKPLSRFERPGHRTRRRGELPVSKGAGYDYVHVCVDDHSRVAYVEVLPTQKGEDCAGFLDRAVRWLKGRDVQVRRVMTDNAKAYTVSHAWRDVLRQHGVQRHLTTRPYRPQTNGKAERFIKTLLHEWAYGREYPNSKRRNQRLPAWVRHYNQDRPHGSLGRAPPASRLPG